jgi:hypothetical protein
MESCQRRRYGRRAVAGRGQLGWRRWLKKDKRIFRRVSWLGNLDSNQDKQSQSLLCYRYTIPHRAEPGIDAG